MSIDELDLILKKDPIIATWPVSALKSNPAGVEQDYATHAKTYLSLGDTRHYVDILFRWVGGGNKGAFIGAVEGDYGEGKTSFLVHLWAESVERRVFAVPPFEWASLADAIDGVAAWIQYVLGRTHPALAKRATHLHEDFQKRTVEDIAAQTARQTDQEYETVLATVRALLQGASILTEISAATFLDYCEKATEVVKEAGYVGLLVLLDEPEVAARKLSKEKVSQWLFELANELHQRSGDYGVFLSMPSNFLADIQRRYPALPARLQVRNCFPRLRDVYGPDFAQVLWTRYVAEFALGDEGARIVSPLALQAIGQVTSSERWDLSYGPRTVVSTFNRMVYRYRESGQTYEPEAFVQDCLDDEIMIKEVYPSKVREALHSPEVGPANRDAVLFLAAFPNGLRLETAREKGVEQALRDLCRRGSLVYKTSFVFGLNSLKQSGIEGDPLRDAILDIAGRFAPSQAVFAKALAAFNRYIIPMIFRPREGQQLVGWDQIGKWAVASNGAHVAGFVGAFTQTQHHFPRRAMIVVTSSLESRAADIPMPKLPSESGPLQFDGAVHFRFRWHTEQEAVAGKLRIKPGDAAQGTFPYICLTIDLQDRIVRHDILADLVEAGTLTPLWLLYLLGEMDAETLLKETEAQWQAMRGTVLRELVPVFFDEDLGPLAAEQLGQPISGTGLDFLGSLFQKILAQRYPTYSTLIRSPQWEQRVDDYIRALKNNDIPLAYKRGREKWQAEGDLAAKALGTSRMNLTGGGFSGFDNLLVVTQLGGRNAPLELEFRIHPLERQITDLITSEAQGTRKKIKIEGAECWWLPVSDLLPVIKQCGYTIEELQKIIEIGSSRGSFMPLDHKGQRVLYCKPIDPEQMREQLRAKLADLEAQIELFKQLPEFTPSLDIQAMQDETGKVDDEVSYERLVIRLNREFEQLHSRLPTYYGNLQQRFIALRAEIKVVTDQLSGAREVTTLKNSPSGKSRWCADLLKYIVGNLRKSVEDLKSEAVKLNSELEGQILRFARPSNNPTEAVAVLVQGYAALLDKGEATRQLKQRRDDLIAQLRDYEEWLRLLRRSDEVYESLLQLQSDELHEATAESLLGDHDKLSGDITDHLQLRNILGLSVHKHFAVILEEIDDRRKQYLMQLKGGFDKRKDAVNQALATLKLDRRASVVFNPMDVEGCYNQMFEQAAQIIREAAVGQPLTEAEGQERELVYAKDVLKSVDEAEAAPLLERLSTTRAKLGLLGAKVTRSWVQAASEPEAGDALSAVSVALDETLAAVRQARQVVKASTKVTVPDKGRPRFMHDLIPDKGAIDLKQLVLQMMADSGDPAHVLDESLECIVDLFKRNCIQISIERRRT